MQDRTLSLSPSKASLQLQDANNTKVLGSRRSLSLLHRKCSQATSPILGRRSGESQFRYRNVCLANWNSIVLSAAYGLLFNNLLAIRITGWALKKKTLMPKPHPRRIKWTVWGVLWVACFILLEYVCYAPLSNSNMQSGQRATTLTHLLNSGFFLFLFLSFSDSKSPLLWATHFSQWLWAHGNVSVSYWHDIAV